MSVKELYTTWCFWRDIPQYQRYLNINPAELNALVEWDDKFDDFAKEQEKFWRTNIMLRVEKSINVFKDEIDEEFRISRKLEYLQLQIDSLERYIKRYDERLDVNRLREIPWKTRELLADMWDIEEHKKKLNKVMMLFYLTKNKKEMNGKITPDMVNIAKQYPLTELVDFSVRGFAKCPFHTERTASFSYWKKTNMGHCFGCRKTVDTIGYVMQIQKKSFVDAVNILCSLNQ